MNNYKNQIFITQIQIIRIMKYEKILIDKKYKN